VSDVAISVRGVSKSFKLPHERHTGLKQAVLNFRPGKKYEMQHVLDNISFEIKQGEFFGIVGRNGSGKSTLLKLLAQIYTPGVGEVVINGSLTPFIELGVGFNPELTGRENVFLNGALLGFDRKQMDAMYDEIVAFAELERFMDQKLKNYSSGMQVRLAFSIAIRAESDILLLDEVLAVGDEGFQRKCFKYFGELKKDSKTVVFVTHDMESFEKYCDRGILVDSGKIIDEGEPMVLSAKYKLLNMTAQSQAERPAGQIFDDSIDKANVNGSNKAILKSNDTITVELEVTPKRNVTATAGVSVRRNDGTYIGFHSTKDTVGEKKLKKGQTVRFRYALDAEVFLAGTYIIDVALYDPDGNYIDLKSGIGQFVILGRKDTSRGGILKLKGNWAFHEVG
jgi:ABC-2 type transport system ATP-binding protein